MTHLLEFMCDNYLLNVKVAILIVILLYLFVSISYERSVIKSTHRCK